MGGYDDVQGAYSIRADDLTGAAVIALIQHHLADMAAHTPAQSMHALPLEGLTGPDVTFWSAWSGDRLAGFGALKELGPAHGEIKSMRAADEFRGQGVGEAILLHVLSEARRRGYTRVSLETGGPEPFWPAQRLYAKHGFVPCPPFADYTEDPFSVYLTLELPA